MTLQDFMIESIAKVVRNGGKLVGLEQAKARRAICNGCPNKGKTELLPLIQVDYCRLCKCPLKTKTKTLTTVSLTGVEKKEICPHPDGNKWVLVDNQFSNNQ